MNRPFIVDRAFKILGFSLTLSFINIFVSYSDSLQSAALKDALPLLSSFADPTVLLIGLPLFFWASFIFLYYLLTQRSKGARIFLLISVGFALFGALFDLVGFNASISGILSLAITALQTYSCYLFYRPESTEWFQLKRV